MPVSPPSPASPPATELLESWLSEAENYNRFTVDGTYAFLAAQPAAPADDEKDAYDRAPSLLGSGNGQPAAPTAVERGKMIERMFDDEAAPACTEAEPAMTDSERDSWKGRVAFWQHTAENVAHELEVKTRRTEACG